MGDSCHSSGGPEAAWEGHRPARDPEGVSCCLRHGREPTQQSWELLQYPHHIRLRLSPSLRRKWGPSNSKHPADHSFSRAWAFLLLSMFKNDRPDVWGITGDRAGRGILVFVMTSKFRGPTRIKAWCRLLVRVDSPRKDLRWFRGIVGNLAKGHLQLLYRRILWASFSHTAKKKQSCTIFQNASEWIAVELFKGFLWW